MMTYGQETSNVRTGGVYQRAAVPEYLRNMTEKARKNKQTRRRQAGDGTFTLDTKQKVAETVTVSETPPHIIPFEAQHLTLNLAPPHGHMPPVQQRRPYR